MVGSVSVGDYIAAIGEASLPEITQSILFNSVDTPVRLIASFRNPAIGQGGLYDGAISFNVWPAGLRSRGSCGELDAC